MLNENVLKWWYRQVERMSWVKENDNHQPVTTTAVSTKKKKEEKTRENEFHFIYDTFARTPNSNWLP